MPNHCEQDLYVTGPRADVARLIFHVRERAPDEAPLDAPDSPKQVVEDVKSIYEKHARSCFSADSIIPYPRRFKDMDAAYEKAGGMMKAPIGMKDGFNSGGYEWCVQHWGSKWGAYDATMKRTTRGVTYHFTSAWSPLTKLIAHLAHAFPTLRFRLRYFESGMAFQGEAIFEKGALVSDERDDYHGSRGG